MRNHEILPRGIVLENENNILSRRELEIIILVAAGFENNQIACIFQVTLSTVKKQLEKIYEKLRAKNRANAIFIACIHNLISLNDYNLIVKSAEIIDFIAKCNSYSNKKYY